VSNRAARRSKKQTRGVSQGVTPRRAGVTPQRVTWASNSPHVPTGYGVQTAQVVTRMSADGHEVAVACNYGLAGAETSWHDVKLYPCSTAPYSDDILRAHAQHWESGSDLPGLVMILFDVWALKAPGIAKIPKIAAWAPIDHQPAPPDVVEWLKRQNVMPIAMSRFGSRMMDLEKIEHLYAPHAVERVFKYSPTMSDATGKMIRGRDIMKAPEDAFVVMINAANKGRTPPRKCWGENLLAFSIFAERHDDAILYLHTDISESTTGVDLESLIHAAGIPIDRVRFVDQYIYRMNMPQNALATLYSDADVLLAVSAGEGFGVPVIEAQACGTRVIVSNFSAQPELVGEGWLVDGQPLWDPFQRSWFFTPRVEEIVHALEEAYSAPREPSEKAIDFMKQYDADHVYDKYWRPIMEKLAKWQP
jgi:glycosyltransferase involved in cell wall biosynthesis